VITVSELAGVGDTRNPPCGGREDPGRESC
jgi:hypothetical protein